jgi:hypothetical protein
MPVFAIVERGGSFAFFAEEGRWDAWGCFFVAASLSVGYHHRTTLFCYHCGGCDETMKNCGGCDEMIKNRVE